MLVYSIVSEVGYALSANVYDPTGQLILAEVNSASNLQLWSVSYFWRPDHQRDFMVIVNVGTGLAACTKGRGDSSQVCQAQLRDGSADALTWFFDRVKFEDRAVGTITAGYESNCYPSGNHWCQVMNAQGDSYHPGVKIITYHLDNHYPKNSLWEFRPVIL